MQEKSNCITGAEPCAAYRNKKPPAETGSAGGNPTYLKPVFIQRL